MTCERPLASLESALGASRFCERFDLVDRGEEVLVLGVGLAGRGVELGQVDAGLRQEVLVGDELVELLDELGLVGGDDRRELGGLLGQHRD